MWVCNSDEQNNSPYRAQQEGLLRPGATAGVDASNTRAPKRVIESIPGPHDETRELSIVPILTVDPLSISCRKTRRLGVG